ncbi:hypothetical protein INT45_002723 [Circinella minor]|uniref:PQ-loop repeat-containing protein 1 n=1 Tax=Circinella minor TaxID=1195481 RepID=A0A8H7S3V2_9FUNG|nr:hypothetical protein INT45_002723 [Circinella minor]
MSDLASVALSIAMAIGPVIGYVDQYILSRLGKRFDITLLIQSLVMITAQLVLLEIVIRYKPIVKYEQQQQPLLDDEQQYHQYNHEIMSKKNQSGIKAMLKKIWAWDHYLDYVNFLLGFTTTIAVAYQLFGYHAWFIETLGVLSLGIESTLPLPQCVSNFKRRSTTGFSAIVMATWFLGDSFKLFYFIFTRSPVQFYICGAVQLTIDSLIVMQAILFSTKVKKQLGVSSCHSDLVEEQRPGFTYETIP